MLYVQGDLFEMLLQRKASVLPGFQAALQGSHISITGIEQFLRRTGARLFRRSGAVKQNLVVPG